jgi:hypothetical protein
MKTMTAEDLRRHALAVGAEAVIDGEVFNTAMAKVRYKPPPAPKALDEPLPQPEPPDTFTRAEVRQLLEDQESRMQAHMQTMVAMFKAAQPPAKAEKPDRPLLKSVVPTYDRDGAITRADIEYRSETP